MRKNRLHLCAGDLIVSCLVAGTSNAVVNLTGYIVVAKKISFQHPNQSSAKAHSTHRFQLIIPKVIFDHLSILPPENLISSKPRSHRPYADRLVTLSFTTSTTFTPDKRLFKWPPLFSPLTSVYHIRTNLIPSILDFIRAF